MGSKSLFNLVTQRAGRSLRGEEGTVPELLQSLAVDEELLQRSAASTLGGTATPANAEVRVRDFHYHLAIDQGRSERQRLSGKLSKFESRKRRLQTELREAESRLSEAERYVQLPFQPSDVTKKPWTAAVTSKLVLLCLAVVAALCGGIVTISGVLLSQPTWDNPVKAYTIAVAFVVLPAFGVSLKYKALLKKNPEAAQRFRGAISWGIIVCFIVGAASYALLYSDRGDPGAEVDLAALASDHVDAPIKAPTFEKTLFRYLPAVLTFMIVLLDFLAVSYCKTHISDLIEEFGWPRIAKKQENAEWRQEETLRRRLSEELADLYEQETTVEHQLHDLGERLEARAQQLCTEALTRLSSKLDAVARVRRELPLVFGGAAPMNFTAGER
ncbi:MAG TPA: hypothetical protein VFE33_08425 [Thermoanaerobaculia bacterium]|nr:hypothetical protein [Thermoanaerobaculia bacterium]